MTNVVQMVWLQLALIVILLVLKNTGITLFKKKLVDYKGEQNGANTTASKTK